MFENPHFLLHFKYFGTYKLSTTPGYALNPVVLYSPKILFIS
jgi:hypothetical protein